MSLFGPTCLFHPTGLFIFMKNFHHTYTIHCYERIRGILQHKRLFEVQYNMILHYNNIFFLHHKSIISTHLLILEVYHIPPYKFIPPYLFNIFLLNISPTCLLHPTHLFIFHEKSHLHNYFTLHVYLAHQSIDEKTGRLEFFLKINKGKSRNLHEHFT